MGKKGKRKMQQSANQLPDVVVDKEVLTLCQRIFELISLETPVLPVKQWEEHVKLREMVEIIRKRQAGQSLFENSDQCRRDHISSFTQWFNDNGGVAESVVIDDFGHQGLGLKAINEIKEGQHFITIPRKLMMSAETARNSDLGPLIDKDNILKVMQNACLVLHVYCEKLKENSFWKPYLGLVGGKTDLVSLKAHHLLVWTGNPDLYILPASYSTTLYFSLDEMQALKGSPAFGESVKLYRNIARQYSYLYQRLHQVCPETAKLPLRRHFTFDDHRWAVSTVTTRQNKIPSTTGEPTLALIPMWDMCNHCNGTITTGYDLAEDSCKSMSVRDFHVGEQVCIFYGERSNADLLVHNGFVFEENAHDKVSIQLGVSKSDPLFQMKERLLASMGMTASSHSFPVGYGERPFDSELVTFLRIFSMTEDELKEWLMKANEDTSELKKLSEKETFVKEETENKGWQFLETRLSLLLKQYKNTDSEDSELLENPVFSHHKKLCIRLKRAEKKVLQIALKHATAIRSKIKDSSQKRVSDCDQDTSRHNAESSTEENTSNMMDATTSAVDQLCVK